VSRRVKHISLVIGAQSACLAVGLWMQHRFVQSASREDATKQEWTELHEVAQRIAPSLSNASDAIQSADREESGHLERLMNAASPPLGGALLVDNYWRISVKPSANEPSPQGGYTVGTQLVWTPAGEPESNKNGPFGYISANSRRDLAAFSPVGSEHRIVVYRSHSAVEAATADIQASLLGVVGFTWLWTTVLLGIATYMVLARFHDETERERAKAAADGMQQRQKLLRTRDAVIFGLAKLADSRDPETGDHLERISVYSTMLASALRGHPQFAQEVSPAFVRLIGISSALHDIGKVGIEDRILLKPGPLTPVERTRIQEHAAMGGDCLTEIEQRLGSSNFLQMARQIAYAHHERWDGTGYPRGLKSHSIPLAARIVAIVDVYDALSSRRVYKGPRKHSECVSIIREAAGTQFDPDLVAVWLGLEAKFCDIARRYANDLSAQPPEQAPTVAAQEVEFGAEKECLAASVGADDE